MQKYEGVFRGKKEMLFNNLLGGMAWGIGATIGASFIISILGLILSKLDFIPFVGTFILQVLQFIENSKLPVR